MTTDTTRLRALMELATPRPWDGSLMRDGRQPEGAEEIGVVSLVDPRSAQKPDGTWTAAVVCRGMDGPTREANAALIVAAVNALPALLDAAERAERAEARVAEMEARLQFADDGLKKLTDAGWSLATQRDRLRARVAELEAIIAGRTTPPTDEEIEAHAAAGGRWVVSHPRGLFGWLAKSEIDAIRTRAAADGWDGVAWLSVASDGRPCAWPTVMP